MAANRALAVQQGVSEETCKQIDKIHIGLFGLMEIWASEPWTEQRSTIIEAIEYDLQKLWNFDQDPACHTWKHWYKFKTQWAGRTFKCNITDETFTIPPQVMPRDFFEVGRGVVDVGTEHYWRTSGVEEVL